MKDGRAAVNVSVSLVSHNQREDLERLLPSLSVAARLSEAEILLVDNRSTDGAVEFVQQNYPSVLVSRNPVKAGYGANHNINLHLARGRYFVIMNSDMVVDPDVLLCLQGFMDRYDDVGIVSPKILNPDGSIQGLNKRYPTILDLMVRRFLPGPFQGLFQRRLDYYEMRDVGYESPCDVPFLSGAFMFCRSDLLKSLGGFDPNYFLYFEDVDLCRRVQATHRTAYLPDTSVTHFWKRSAHGRWVHLYYFVCSARRYFGKWGYSLY